MMHIRYLLILSALLSFTVMGQSKEYKAVLESWYEEDFPTISIEDALPKIGSNNVYFLDTRERNEFEVSHIKTAINVGYNDFNINTLRKIPKDAEIIVYCSIGARSQTIGKQLKAAGYSNVKNLYGGLFHWPNRAYPMRNMSGSKTERIHGYSKRWGKWVTRGKVVYE